MAWAKRKLEGDNVPPPTPDLAGEILRLRGQIETFIDQKLMELKGSRDGASQPIDFLRQQLTRGDSCACRVAMNLLADKSNG
jgi:hypothetical protein